MDEKIAIFFDAENIPADKVSSIIDYLSSKGDILFQRAYADWSIENTKSWKNLLNELPITAIQQFHHNEKQAVDKLLMMDAIEMAIKHPEITLFSIIASDNGYSALALRLRELGKKIIGIGDKNKCKSRWINSCNEFKSLDKLNKKDSEILTDAIEADDSNLADFSLEKFIESAFDSTRLYKDTNSVLLSQLWETVLRNKPDFDVTDYGVKNPRDLILKMNSKFRLSDDGKQQKTFFVEKIDVLSDKSHQRKNGVVKRRIKNYRILEADDKTGDYFFYIAELNPRSKDSRLEKGTKVSFQVVETPEDSKWGNNSGRATDVIVLE